MKILVHIAAILILSGCGGGEDPCPTTETRIQVRDDQGTHWIRCWEFQCPGYPINRTCRVE